ncbi:MAG: hypothetical protein C0485_13785 [Pirellula sp.]|nr:hypothetical protein [Pirellula sp.]
MALLSAFATVSRATMYYDVPTGNVTIYQWGASIYGGASVIYLFSNSGALNPDNMKNHKAVEPLDAFVPEVGIAQEGTAEIAAWSSFPDHSLTFEKLTLFGAITPNTPPSDLWHAYILPGESIPVYDRIVVTPEPSALSLAAIALLSLASLRRRK